MGDAGQMASLLVRTQWRVSPLRTSSGSRRRSWLSTHFVKCERKPLGAIAVSPCDMPAQLANETFRADHVRFGNSVGAVVQVPMCSDVPAAEAFFRDHLLFDHPSISDATTWTATY